MENVEFFDNYGVEWVRITKESGEEITMSKAFYDAQQAQHLNGSVDGETL
jgi:hypothetical protein